jgi:hypothetical protein
MGIIVFGIVVSSLLLLAGIFEIVRGERRAKLNARLESAIAAGRFERDAEAHRLNLEATGRG